MSTLYGLLRCLLAATVSIQTLACGGGSGFETYVDDPEGGVSLSVAVLWQQPGARAAAGAPTLFSSALPEAVGRVRLELETDPGGKCCLEVDPRDPSVAGSTLIVDALPAGEVKLRVSGYAGSTAPAEGVTRLCSTRPPSLAAPCDQQAHEAPSFDSPAATFTALDGKQTRGRIEVAAQPFLTAREPGAGQELRTPGSLRFAVVDAATGIDGASIVAGATFPGGAPEDLSFSSLVECSDGHVTLPDCSEGAALGVSGFLVESGAIGGAAGPLQVRVQADNLNQPAGSLDFSYSVVGLPLAVDLTFRLNDAVTFASVGFDVDYSAAQGDFEGSGAAVDCEGLMAGAINVFNDEDATTRTLRVRSAILDGTQGPHDLARCRFGGFDVLPTAADFSIDVIEATDPDALPIAPVPQVVIASIEAAQ